ncbi:pyridoxal phosphate-dependent aminotransferase [Rickettsiales endosymbiont of Peranema trichophorum]|uniref:pyridoxal phosphate-dependent aminotransferase n=1 Tax=Rickettsiales endosymbiont of Peranema trichophorum TaxID=2486577 RepID=UPI001023EADA|nr:pyridoxal phosphate-dependent aminotransferase [Rickettsiales endosymbiont of Peranema trichophorum]RZI47792.1 pyridoxal phosphate-dependent aminotransferase [Rickettsiales endosymbiont of Peranema trichophorum]
MNTHSLQLAQRVSLIKPSATLAITSKAMKLKAEGKDIISLSIGEPDFDTPDFIKQKGKEAIDGGKTKYTPVDGIMELKAAICQKFKAENDLEYAVEQITVGCGAKQVIFNALFALVDPGDEVIIIAPYWVSYKEMVTIAEGKSIFVECKMEDNFKLRPEVLEAAITDRTKCVILNSPNNPTGAVYTKEELCGLAQVLLKYPHVYIIVDDIYEHLVYDQMDFYTIAQVEPSLKDRVFMVNGMSKGYGMTGWRVGYGAGDLEIIKAINTIQSQMTSNTCSVSQYAALEALKGTKQHINQNKSIFQSRRDLAFEALKDIPGMKCTKPQGAFYIFADCSGFFKRKAQSGNIIENSTDFAMYLLEYASVAVVQGIEFGMEGFFRISYALSEEDLREACRRIRNACSLLT